ncbi:MAG: hypothetical protein AAB840_02540, partial [Patescibacteria group bacterium]
MNRKTNRKEKRTKLSKKINIPKGYFLALALALAGFLFFFVLGISRKGSTWDGKSRLSVAAPQNDGTVLLQVFDPPSKSIARLTIPKNVEIEAAHNLGTWKVGSIWKLGENEHLGGSFLAQSITKSFRFPVEAWSEAAGTGFSQNNVLEIIRSLFGYYKTNLSVSDKIKIALFALKIPGSARYDIDLSKSSYLVAKRLMGGEEGYEVRESIPEGLLSIFSDSSIVSEGAKIYIVDASGRGLENARKFGEILEVLGGKVVALKSVSPNDGDCSVWGTAMVTVKKIIQIFGCSRVDSRDNSQDLGNVVVNLGKAFAR